MLIGKKAAGLNRLQAETGKKIYIHGTDDSSPETFLCIKKGTLKEIEYAFNELESRKNNRGFID